MVHLKSTARHHTYYQLIYGTSGCFFSAIHPHNFMVLIGVLNSASERHCSGQRPTSLSRHWINLSLSTSSGEFSYTIFWHYTYTYSLTFYFAISSGAVIGTSCRFSRIVRRRVGRHVLYTIGRRYACQRMNCQECLA